MTDAYAEPLYIEDIEVGDKSPTVVVEDIDRRDFVKYAGASGDFNPIHYDEPYAREAGNPSPFAQGMLIHGFAAHMVCDWFGLANIRSFTIRFESRAWPSETIRVSGTITDASTDTDVDLVEAEMVAENDERDPVVSGTVTAALPSRNDNQYQSPPA